MKPFVLFMASPAGRVARVVAGMILIAWGLLGLQGTTGVIVAAVGIVPLLAGVLDLCLFAPLCGCPINGAKIRAIGT